MVEFRRLVYLARQSAVFNRADQDHLADQAPLKTRWM